MDNKVRLPLFGESDRDWKMRSLYRDPSLGLFLLKRADDHLILLLDGEIDPAFATYDLLWRFYFQALEQNCEQHENHYESYEVCDRCREVADDIAEWESLCKLATEWMGRRLGEVFNGDEMDLSEFNWHDCRDRVLTIKPPPQYIGSTGLIAKDPPAAAGVYYVLVFDRVKIGKSKNIAARVRDLGTAAPDDLHLVAFELGDPDTLEKRAHDRWREYRRRGEWFACEGTLAEWLLQQNQRGR